MKTKRRESEIQKAILTWLNLQPKTRAIRFSNHSVYDQKRKIYRQKSRHDRGIADIIGVKNGRAFAIEVKAPGCKPTVDQLSWLKWFSESDAYVFWADSLEDAMREYEKISHRGN